MGAYGFKKQFVPLVLDGSKRHTIRGKRKHPDKPNSTFYGFYAMRTKQCVKLIEAPIILVQDFCMERSRVWLDGEELDLSEKNALALADGFRPSGPTGSFDMMLSFWLGNHGSTDFHGDMIHWDYDRLVMLGENPFV